MAHEFERPRITEIHVRMDCNGCVQKIKKAVNGIKGIYDFYIDFPQQKLTIIGTADPERIMKAIKKVRKVATLCSHTEAPDPNSQPMQQPPDAGAPPPDGGAPPPEGGASGQEAGQCQPLEPPQAQEAHPPPPPEPPTDQPPPPYQPENPPGQGQQPESIPPPGQPDMQPIPQSHPPIPNHSPPEYGRSYGYGQGDGYGQSYGPSFRHEPPSQHVYHAPPHGSGYYERPRHDYHDSPNVSGYHQQYQPMYNDPQPRSIYHHSPSQPPYHNPPPPVAYHEQPQPPGGHYSEPPPQTVAYHEPPPQAIHHEQPPQPVYATHNYNMYRPAQSITEYHYVQSPPRYTSNNRTNYSDMDSYEYSNISDRNATSVFSDENPNACTIV